MGLEIFGSLCKVQGDRGKYCSSQMGDTSSSKRGTIFARLRAGSASESQASWGASRMGRVAFTLAEILITIGIIGVVAAMTIPNLISDSNARKMGTQFFKIYSVLQQVFKQMEADDVSLDPSTYSHGSFYKTFARYLKGTQDCGPTGRDIKNCIKTTSSDIFKNMSGVNMVDFGIMNDGQLVLPDGTLLMFENVADGTHGIYITTDINGIDKLPNRWGFDIFTFEFVDGELRPMGDVGTAYTDENIYCNIEKNNYYSGISCAVKAKNDTEYFKRIVRLK